jgi:hypothetical protein
MQTIPFFAALAVAVLLPAGAFAQGARDPNPPRRLEEVIVTQSASGDELRGRLVELSSTTLAILVDGKRVELPLENVLRIEARTDSLKNGAAIGAVTMGGLGVLGCAAVGELSGPCVTSIVINTGFGALAGAGIDALHKGRSTIYSKSPAVAVAPARGGARIQLSLRF